MTRPWLALNALLGLLPVLVAPALGYLLAEDRLNFGGGEKELLLLLPWTA